MVATGPNLNGIELGAVVEVPEKSEGVVVALVAGPGVACLLVLAVNKDENGFDVVDVVPAGANRELAAPIILFCPGETDLDCCWPNMLLALKLGEGGLAAPL